MTDKRKIIRGAGGPPSPPPPRQPTRTPDTLHSKQFATFLDLISEGEIEGSATASKNGITDKTSTGRPTQFYLQRSVTPKIFFYPTPDSTSTYTFKFHALTRIQDAGDDYTNDPEVPFRFLPCLISGLAYYLAMKFNPDKMMVLKQIYDEEWSRAAAEDRDSVSLHLVPGGS